MMECEREMTLSMDFMQGMGVSYSAASLEGAAAATASSHLPNLCGLASSDISTLGVIDLYPCAFHAAATTTADAHLFTSLNYQSSSSASQQYFDFSLDSKGNQSSFDFNIPCEEEAELAWLSQFVEDSFSFAPYQYHATPAIDHNQPQLRPDECNTGRAIRSKRSRSCIPSPVWSTLTLPLLPQQQTSPPSSSSSPDLLHSHTSRKVGGDVGSTRRGKKKGGREAGARRCTHCASDKTPQWRTGPLGPKTLCNACGVRYKSGWLVPEYRPAASPTFVVAQHSNSHRKVMELRRQKEAGVLNSAAGSQQLLVDDDYDLC